MVSLIFGTLQETGTSFISFLKDLLANVITIFYTAPTGSNTTGSLTDIGVLTLCAVAVSFVLFGLRWITRLIKLRG